MDNFGIASAARSIRSLSIDAVQKANSGHPGMPLGAAELGALLYGEILKHNPAHPDWPDRDRFVLSAGHASMLLYAALHLSGYDLTLDDIKSFRQLGSKCPGHPEYGKTPGIENTSGPLGQGIAIAVGMAIAETMLAQKFNTKNYKIVDHFTYALAGEGCLEEGVASEACSLAGHLQLGKLIVFYDENRISIDGSTDITFSEDIKMRYEAYGWQVLRGEMYNPEQILSLVQNAKSEKQKPTLIMLKSVIGKFSPKAGTEKVHGEPLGEDDVAQTKINLGLDPKKFFQVEDEAYKYFERKKIENQKIFSQWQKDFSAWQDENPILAKSWQAAQKLLAENEILEPKFSLEQKIATRSASGQMLDAISLAYSCFVGGSADLKGSNKTSMKNDGGTFSAQNRAGRSIEFGIREFSMANIAQGIALHGGLRVFCATYLVFSDYMRAAIRLCALMKLPVIFILTHDSFFVGEDGPTHQPIEQLPSLRMIPNLKVLRPADAEETICAWKIALAEKNCPTALIFTRQNVPVFKKDDKNWQKNIECGAYIAKFGAENPDVTILATGSEVFLAIQVANLVKNKSVRVVSVPDKNAFENQSEDFKKSILGNAQRVIVCEAASRYGWEGWVKSKDDLWTIDCFGMSAPGQKIAEEFGFTAELLAKKLEN